jgi:hypothetical protein
MTCSGTKYKAQRHTLPLWLNTTVNFNKIIDTFKQANLIIAIVKGNSIRSHLDGNNTHLRIASDSYICERITSATLEGLNDLLGLLWNE